MFYRVGIAFCCLVVLVPSLRAAILSYDGAEPGFWDWHAVVICTIGDNKPTRTGGILSVNVLAVLWTESPLPTKLNLPYYLGNWDSALNGPDEGRRPPSKTKATVMSYASFWQSTPTRTHPRIARKCMHGK